MNVLSLFDGISCGQVALQRAGVSYDRYYASEIDKYAIQITQRNHPVTKQLGDIKNWKNRNIDRSKIDLLLAGFPCQSRSKAGRKEGVACERGSLMYDMIDIYNHIKSINPKVKYLFENVSKNEVVSFHVGEPYKYNSSQVSAQNRQRYYRSNIVPRMEYNSIYLPQPIVQRGRGYNKGGIHTQKSPTLTASSRNTNHHRLDGSKITPEQCEELQTLPISYTEGISNSQRYKCIGNGWTIDVIVGFLRNL